MCASSLTSSSDEVEPILSLNPALDQTLPYRVLAFYAITSIVEPEKRVEAHRAFLAARGMVGRVYICADGLNAQVSGSADACAEYRAFVASGADFSDPDFLRKEALLFKEDPVDELQFPKLRVKQKNLVPGEEVDLSLRGEDLPPEKWAAMLGDENIENKVVLDVRNSYEWDVGRFEGAERPALDQFAEFDAATYGLPDDPEERKQTPVMMYCTGG